MSDTIRLQALLLEIQQQRESAANQAASYKGEIAVLQAEIERLKGEAAKLSEPKKRTRKKAHDDSNSGRPRRSSRKVGEAALAS